MSQQLVLGVVGAAIGGYFGGVQGAQAGFALGSAIGAATTVNKVQGPRLTDLKGPSSSYGTAIAYVEGTMRVPGLWIWNSDKIEVQTTEDQGGKGGPSTETTTYTYELNCLIMLSENPIVGVRRIWANGKLVYTRADGATGADLTAAEETPAWDSIIVYTGADDQLPDPTYEAAVGVGNAPAYRGRGVIAINRLKLGGSGTVPMLSFEVVTSGQNGTPVSVEGAPNTAIDTITILGTQASTAPTYTFNVDNASLVVGFEKVSGAYSGWPDNGASGVPVDGAWTSRFATYAYGPNTTQSFLTPNYFNEEEASAAGVGEVFTRTGATQYGIWLNDPAPSDNRGSLTIAIYLIGVYVPIQPVAVPLATVVSRQCERAGLLPTEYDVTQLSTLPDVWGFAITQLSAPRVILEALMTAYHFEATESEGKLKFRPRGSASVVTIPYEELGAAFGESNPEPLPMSRASDIEMPAEVVVTFANRLNDYQDGAESAQRLTTAEETSVDRVDLFFALTPTEARRIAEVKINDISTSFLRIEALEISRRYAFLEPCDVITVFDGAGASYRMRIGQITDKGVVRALTVSVDEASAVVGKLETDVDYEEGTIDGPPAGTLLRLLDIPLLRDQDDGRVHYIAVQKDAITGTWSQATVFRGVANAAYTELVNITEGTFIGTADTTLGNFTGGYVFDEVNSLVVTGVGTLENYTRAQILEGTAKALLVGSEVIYYRNATPFGSPLRDGVYQISGLLRGVKGTDWAISSHGASERVILLQSAGIRRVLNTAAELNVAYDFKAVGLNESLDAVTPVAFTNTGIALKPYSPVDLRGSLSTDNSVLLNWKRRTRLQPSFCGTAGISVPLGETTEAYEVDIMNGTTVMRTLTSSTPSVSYSSANQLSDFGSIQSVVTVKVYQMSSIVGRGYPLTATLALAAASGGGGSSITDPYESLIQLTGTFTTGIPITVNVGATELASHTVVGGDTDLSGVATALADDIDPTGGFEALARGPVVEIDGQPGVSYELTTLLGGGSSITWALVQTAAQAGPGSSYVSNFFVSNVITGATEPIPAGTTFTLLFQVPIFTTIGTVSFTTTGVSTREDVYRGLAAAAIINPGGALYELGYRISVSSNSFGYFGVIIGPVGETNLYIAAGQSGAFTLGNFVQSPGSPVVVADRFQQVRYTINGTPQIGEQFSIVLDGVPFSFTATTASADDVATGLAAAVDLSASYSATSSTNTVLVSGVSALQAFTYSGSVLRAIRALTLYESRSPRTGRDFSPYLYATDGTALYAYTEQFMDTGPTGGTGYRVTRFWKAANVSSNFILQRTRIGATTDPTSVPLMLPGSNNIAQTTSLVLRFDGADTSPWGFARATFALTSDPVRADDSDLPTGAKPVAMCSDGTRVVLLAADGKGYSSTDGVTWTDLGSYSGSFPATLAFNNATLQKIGSRWWLVVQNTGGFSGEVNSNILFYNDSADPVGAWTTAGQPSYTRAPALNVHEELLSDGTRLHAFVNHGGTGQVLVFSSTDNGTSWSQEATINGIQVFKVQLDTRGSPTMVRLIGGNTSAQKQAGGTSWGAAYSNGLNSPFYGVIVGGTAVVSDNLNGPFDTANYSVKKDDLNGIFSTPFTFNSI